MKKIFFKVLIVVVILFSSCSTVGNLMEQAQVTAQSFDDIVISDEELAQKDAEADFQVQSIELVAGDNTELTPDILKRIANDDALATHIKSIFGIKLSETELITQIPIGKQGLSTYEFADFRAGLYNKNIIILNEFMEYQSTYNLNAKQTGTTMIITVTKSYY